MNPGLARRLDLLAVAKPKMVERQIWFSGLMTVWTFIGLVVSVLAGEWSVAAILLVAAALSGFICIVSIRAKRRTPETSRWLEQLSSS